MHDKSAVNATGIWVEVVKQPVSPHVLEAWKALAANPLEANPFLAPAYLGLIAQHLAHDADWRLALVWKDGARSQLMGLAPVVKAGGATAPQYVLQRHHFLPLGQPLLIAEMEAAQAALHQLLSFLGNGTSVDMGTVTRGGPVATLLKAICNEQNWLHDIEKDASRTHGMHLHNTQSHAATPQVDMVTSAASMRDGFERLLTVFASANFNSAKHAIARENAALSTFLRAMTRAMAKTDGIVLAQINTDAAKAGAIALRHGQQSWILHMDGPDANDPAVQALLCHAIGKVTGAPPFSLAKPRLTGLSCAPLTTESWNITKARNRPAGRSIMLTARRIAASIF